ncbi:hypothetical protein CLU79DRAFT_848619 [Phycomyces nitens]|nr:hypothetical protein CLU79DRAFT_848619 [Phycomyces nitens]
MNPWWIEHNVCYHTQIIITKFLGISSFATKAGKCGNTGIHSLGSLNITTKESGGNLGCIFRNIDYKTFVAFTTKGLVAIVLATVVSIQSLECGDLIRRYHSNTFINSFITWFLQRQISQEIYLQER